MGVTIFRPGRAIVMPGIGVQAWSPGVASAASGGWWDNNGAISGCVAAYAPKGAASLAASYTNLTGNATYNAAPGVAPTHSSADGWTFNGSTQYLTTGITPTTTYTALCRYSDYGGINKYFFGAYKTAGTIIFGAYISTSGRGYWNGTAVLTVGTSVSSGVQGIAGNTAYYNGSRDGTIVSAANTGLTMYIGALNNDGSPLLYLSGKIQALAIYSTTLTAGEVATITTAMQAL